MILGTGIDVTEVPRVAESISRFGDRFLQRVYTAEEIAYCIRQRDPVPSLAARFAAKEAAMKALGTGHSRGVLWKGIDQGLIDGVLVNGSAKLARAVGGVGSWLQSGQVGTYAWVLVVGVLAVLGAFTIR